MTPVIYYLGPFLPVLPWFDFESSAHSLSSANTAETALKQWQRTQESLNDMGSQHAATIASHVRLVNILWRLFSVGSSR